MGLVEGVGWVGLVVGERIVGGIGGSESGKVGERRSGTNAGTLHWG